MKNHIDYHLFYDVFHIHDHVCISHDQMIKSRGAAVRGDLSLAHSSFSVCGRGDLDGDDDDYGDDGDLEDDDDDDDGDLFVVVNIVQIQIICHQNCNYYCLDL